MRQTLLGLFVSAAAAFLAHATADAQESNPAPPLAEQRGAFQTTLPERSPTSTTAELAKRLNVKPAADAEYDLTKEQFWVYVPPDYDASQKYGLTVYLNYKG